MRNPFLKFATLGALAMTLALPSMSMAESRYDRHRDQQQNTWKNVALGSAALGILGAIKGDRNLTILGAAGALYGGYRYEADRESDRHYGRYDYDRYSRHDRDWRRDDHRHFGRR